MKKKDLFQKTLFVLLFFPLLLSGQILDDSTRLVYSFKTVQFRFEKDIFLNDTTYRQPDSTLGNVQRANPLEVSGYAYQDLGNIGSAARSIQFVQPQSAGIQFGFNVFDLYRQRKSDVKYYNTKSPYTLLKYLQTNRVGAYFDFIHSQNISPRLNITLDVNRTASSKQINPGTNREERLINGWNTVVSSNYVSENKNYTVAGHFNHLNFQQIEQGGIVFERNQFLFPMDSVNLYSDRISNSASRTMKNSLYGIQQLKLASGFDVFHRFELENNSSGFRDSNVSSNADQDFYNYIAVQPDTIDWRMRYHTVQNAIGLKGYYKGYLANAYVKHRFVSASLKDSITLRYTNSILKRNEFLVGGGFEAKFKDSLVVLNANTELNLGLQSAFVLDSKLKIKGLQLGFYFSNTIPDFIYTRFELPNYSWNNDDFKNQTVSAFSGNYTAMLGKLSLSAFGRFQLIDNYLYFSADNLPAQQEKVLTVLSVGGSAKFSLGKFTFENNLQFNQSPQAFLPMPRIENNLLIYYQFNYAKTLDLRIGLDNFFKSAYFAPAYNPIVQQFYLQNGVEVWGYNLTDAFVSFMVRKVRLSFKFGHVNQGVFPRVTVQENGRSVTDSKALIVTPDYPGLRRTFNIRVVWPLFD